MAKIKLPNSAALAKAMEVANFSDEGAAYLSSQYAARLKKAGQNSGDFKKVLSVLEQNAANLKAVAEQASRFWSGEASMDDAIAVARSKANQASKALGQKMEQEETQDIRVDFAVSDQTEFLRGYSAQEEGTVKLLDDLFNAWLAENGMVNKIDGGNSYIYQRNADNQKVDPEKLRQLMVDGDKGFAAYVQKKNKSLHLDLHSNPFPERAAQASSSGGGATGH